MRPFTTLTSFDDARRIIEDAAQPTTRTETVPLIAAAGRVLAEDVLAPTDIPAFDRSAMDGYAVRAGDIASAGPNAPVSLRLAGKLYAGAWREQPLERGECVLVGTGSPIPEGADAVVRVEDTTPGEQEVLVHTTVQPGHDVAPAGGDLRAGEPAATQGACLTPALLGAAAATGAEFATLLRRPRVTLFTTGDEVVRPGQPLRRGQVYDVNMATLSALLTRHGAQPVDGGHCGDTLNAVRESLDAALHESDAVVFTGGSSVGDRDLVVDAVHQVGAEVLFHGVAQRPGKPLLLARAAGGALIFGVPGNPTSALLGGYVHVAPAMRRIAGLPEWNPAVALALMGEDLPSPKRLCHFLPVRLEDGRAWSTFRGSGAISSLARADGWITIPEGSEGVAKGDQARVTLFE